MALSPADRTNDIYTIPVVVHVIHEGEAYGMGSNISDEQIFSAISAMNDDFRKVSGTNGYGAGVDVQIQFCLASRNPSGQPTTGINRVNGSSVALYADQGIESSGAAGADEATVKALSTWPRTEYVNIRIVNEIENNDTDFKSKLINYCQQRKKKIDFVLVKEIGQGPRKEFVISVEINGKAFGMSQHISKRKAEQRAAELSIQQLEENGLTLE